MDDMATHEAFARYASAQAAFGLYLLRTHGHEASGSCRECALVHPCAQRRHGAELIIHFGHWKLPAAALRNGCRHTRHVAARTHACYQRRSLTRHAW